jgi:predicted enzyme related to lactoylglutathione lyase
MSHAVIWFDVPVVDLTRAITFYSAVLAMNIAEDVEHKLGVLDHGDGEVSGCLTAHGDKPSADGPLLYFNVNGRLDDAIAQVEMQGGRILAPKHSIGPYGWRALVLDSEGNRIALHSQ